MIRRLEEAEYAIAAKLAIDVVSRSAGDDFDESGFKTFGEFVTNADCMRALTFYGAFVEGQLAGLIAVNDAIGHISLLFVNPEYQRMGLGTALFDAAFGASHENVITVNSSTYGIPFYKSLGFQIMGEKATRDGITSTPMRRLSSHK